MGSPCAICLDELPSEAKGAVEKCTNGHKFHPECARRWVRSRHGNTCPLCKAKFENQIALGKRLARSNYRGDFDWPTDNDEAGTRAACLANVLCIAGGRVLGLGMVGVFVQVFCSALFWITGWVGDHNLGIMNTVNSWCFIVGASLVAVSFCLSCMLVLD
jgi:hypothetical protein